MALANNDVSLMLASMRPRRFRRGIARLLPAAAYPMVGFNEASAISPRNLCARPEAGPRTGGFNEASAISPRNLLDTDPTWVRFVELQ